MMKTESCLFSAWEVQMVAYIVDFLSYRSICIAVAYGTMEFMRFLLYFIEALQSATLHIVDTVCIYDWNIWNYVGMHGMCWELFRNHSLLLDYQPQSPGH